MAARRIRGWWWVDFRVEGVRYRKRSPESSRAGAQAYEALLRRRLAAGEPLHPSANVILLREFAKQWFETYVRTNNKPSEQRTKESALRIHLLPRLGHLPLGQLSAVEIERYKSHKLEEGLSAKTVNNHLAILGRCLRTAQEWGLLPVVPRIRLLRAPPSPFDCLSADEARRLLGYTAEPMLHEMLLLALRTGLRLGEIIGLEWQDVDLDNGVLHIRRSVVRGISASPKSNRERHIPLVSSVYDVLRARWRSSGLVFPRPDGGPLTYIIAGNAIRRACRAVGLRPVGWHALRHTFASQLVAMGVPISSVQQLLGHATIQMTTRYVHVTHSMLCDAVQLLEGDHGHCAPRERGHPVGTKRLAPPFASGIKSRVFR
jgi:integrase